MDGDLPAQLRVLTLNLLSPDHADWDRRRPVIRAGIERLRPDLVALQETVWGQGHDQTADLLGSDYHLARHSGRSADGVGAVLGSRWPLGADLTVPARPPGTWSWQGDNRHVVRTG
jgi:hypothetical protein